MVCGAAGLAAGGKAERLRHDEPERVMAEVASRGPGKGVLYDALGLQEFDVALLEIIARRRRLKGPGRQRGGLARTAVARALTAMAAALESAPLKTGQRHTSVRFGERLVLKLFRRLHWGVNPELELGRFLTERSFPHAPPLAGALEYHRADGERLAWRSVHGWVAKAESGWEYTLRALDRYYERVLSCRRRAGSFPPVDTPLIQLVRQEFPAEVPELVGTYLESARLLGCGPRNCTGRSGPETGRTRSLPLNRSRPTTSEACIRPCATPPGTACRNCAMAGRLAGRGAPLGARVRERGPQILKRFHSLLTLRVSAARIRCHGDYGLGQVLHTGKDFVMVDFEGHRDKQSASAGLSGWCCGMLRGCCARFIMPRIWR